MSGDHTGARILMWRKRRGISQRVLADRIGKSQGYVSQVENALLAIDKRSTLAAFAAALDVSTAELCGTDIPPSEPHARAESAIPPLRVALAEVAAGERFATDRTAADIRASVAELKVIRDRSDYAVIAPQLPGLLRAASAYGAVPLAATAYLCASALRELRHRDLALIAAMIAVEAAGESGDPIWIAAAESARLHTMPFESSLNRELARRALADAESHFGQEPVRRVAGMLHLQAVLAATIADEPGLAADHLAEAVRMAQEDGEPDVRDTFTPHMHFGPTNLNLWRMTSAIEAGDPREALAIAKTTSPGHLGSQTRTAMYWLDSARAFAGVRADEQAVTALVRAEATAPQLFRLRREAQDAVITLVGRARRNAIPPPLMRLARAFGA